MSAFVDRRRRPRRILGRPGDQMWLPRWNQLLAAGTPIRLGRRRTGDTADQVVTMRSGMGLLAAGGPVALTGPGTVGAPPRLRRIAVTAD
jgi:hypothetical protein